MEEVVMPTALQRQRNEDAKPNVFRVALLAGVGLGLLGAAYLYAVRGTAIIFDLASGMAGMFCF
jgi:hypothetical protein